MDNFYSEDLPIPPKERFKGDRDAYSKSLELHNKLPLEIEHLRHTLDWPVDMTDPRSHITCYYGTEQNYSDSEPSDYPHCAIDVQLPLESQVISPEDDLIVVINMSSDRINKARGLTDLLLYSKKNGIVYWFVHLDALSVPDNIKSRSWFDKWSDVKLKKGEKLGTVGKFFSGPLKDNKLTPNIDVPEDVNRIYGRTYNHVHIETHFIPNINQLHVESNNPINPLLLFKKLY